MIKYNNCGINISGQHIMAQNISISEQNSIAPIYYAGYPSIGTYSPTGPIKNSVQINYLLETNDINYKIINGIRNYVSGICPVSLYMAGLQAHGYPTDFSLDITPNDVIKASISYTVFSGFAGILAEESSSTYTGYNPFHSSGIGHYWTTYFKNATSTGSVLQGRYSMTINWKPIYKIGQKTPADVKFIDAQETFNFLSEYESRIAYSGENFASKFTDFNIIEINPISIISNITGEKLILYPDSGRIISNKIDISDQNLILNDTSIVKFY